MRRLNQIHARDCDDHAAATGGTGTAATSAGTTLRPPSYKSDRTFGSSKTRDHNRSSRPSTGRSAGGDGGGEREREREHERLPRWFAMPPADA
jgi:hypothetical protein